MDDELSKTIQMLRKAIDSNIHVEIAGKDIWKWYLWLIELDVDRDILNRCNKKQVNG